MIYQFTEKVKTICIQQFNAANTDKDFDWFLKQKGNYDVEIKNISSETAQIALQGPKAEKVLQKLAKKC